MNQQNLLNFDNHDFDLNSLFMFSFEQFKLLISSLAKSQKVCLQRINEIEDKITMREKKLDDFEKQLKKQENYMATKFKNMTNFAVNNATNKAGDSNPEFVPNQNSSNNIIQNGNNELNSFVNVIAREGSVDSSEDKKNGDYINIRSIKLNEEEGKRKLLIKLSQLEKSIIELESKGAPNKIADKNLKELNEKLLAKEKSIDHLNAQLEELKKSNDKLVKDIEEVSLRVQDFNIYDIFQSNVSEGGTADASIILIQNLEKKLFKKFEFIDEKLKKVEEDTYRYKNEISNFKILIENSNKAMNLLKEENEKHNKNEASLSTLIETKYTELDAKLKELKDQYVHINDSFEVKMNFLKESQKEELNKAIEESKSHIITTQHNLEEDNKSKNSVPAINEAEMKMVKECIKKTLEFEKNFKVFVNAVNIEHIKSEIVKMHDTLNLKLNISDIEDFKETLSQNNSQITFLKDTISQLLEDRKMIEDIAWLRKKVDLLSSSMSVMKHIGDDGSNNNNFNNTHHRQTSFDTSKFVDQFSFLDFQKSIFREVDYLKRFSEELKRYIDDLLESNKNKADEKDIRNLEEFLNSKVDEIKLTFTKKFADKTETSKNIKYLDAQLKHIVDSYLKKTEKGDNWLIAKKPVGGYACASCESYIGKLQDSTNQHVPWNKYPQRDPNEKAYRIGNGYSRMLQMLSLDFKKNATNYPHMANSFNESDDERSFSHTKNKQDFVLPSLKIQNPLNLNISADLIKTDDEKHEEIKSDPQQPKIVKIYKKAKNSNQKEMGLTDINNNLRMYTLNK